MKKCVFCGIAAGKAPAVVVREWPDALAIRPRSGGVTEGHVMVLPRVHVADAGTDPEVTAAVMRRAAELMAEHPAANLITSRGADATQSVFHLHVHVVPRRADDGLALPWTPAVGAYTPTDVTPPELRPEALAHHVPDWAEAAPTPDHVHDWDRRRASALMPFGLDERGWLLHPHGRTGWCGRNLGKWGENAAADPIVVAGSGDRRRVLLITRDDIHVEAIPGGMVDPGETAPAALVRELREETGIDLSDEDPIILGVDVVDDWRATDHAWVVSTSALYLLPATVTAVAADDALDANWWPFASLGALDAAITAAGRTLYAAHRPLLRRALDHLDT